MNVLYVDLEREWRGGQSQALLTLRGLRERGHEVDCWRRAIRRSRIAPQKLESRFIKFRDSVCGAGQLSRCANLRRENGSSLFI